MTYQTITGALTPGGHPGSYNGQDAYNDMLVTDDRLLRGKRTVKSTDEPCCGCAELYARSTGDINRGGGDNMTESIVRRLTPRECERLQGFPDNWTLIGEPGEVDVKDYDIKYDADWNVVEKTLVGTHKETGYFYVDQDGKRKKCSDSARYKALGNSIARPFWTWLARRICAQYEQTPTMASLFDGIGGFPLCFSEAGAKPVWASEIEEFPIAVTKLRFPEEAER